MKVPDLTTSSPLTRALVATRQVTTKDELDGVADLGVTLLGAGWGMFGAVSGISLGTHTCPPLCPPELIFPLVRPSSALMPGPR